MGGVPRERDGAVDPLLYRGKIGGELAPTARSLRGTSRVRIFRYRIALGQFPLAFSIFQRRVSTHYSLRESAL